MYLVRIGYRTVNLEYLIEAADSELGAPVTEVPTGQIRVSIYPGQKFNVGGDDAARLRLHLEDNVRPSPAGDVGPEKAQRAARRPRSGKVERADSSAGLSTQDE